MNLFGLISGLFLGDALRRIWITFKNLRGLYQNEKIMFLHLVLFFVYIFSKLFQTLQVSKYIGDQASTEKYARSLICYSLNIWF